MAVVGIWLALRYRMPIAVAWSTPGAALLISSGPPPGGYPAALGAFAVCGGLIVLAGLWRTLERWVAAIPVALASAMLAGVLLPVCLEPVRGVVDAPLDVGPVIVVWALLMRFARPWAVPGALAVAAVVIALDPVDGLAVSLAARAHAHGAGARRRCAGRPRAAALPRDDGLAEHPRDGRAGELRLSPAARPAARRDRRGDRDRGAVRRARGQPRRDHRRADGRAGRPPGPGPALDRLGRERRDLPRAGTRRRRRGGARHARAAAPDRGGGRARAVRRAGARR